MNLKPAGNALSCLALLAFGMAAATLLVEFAGKILIPFVDAADKAILAAVNPDQYVPGLDEFIRALTDYTNYLIFVPVVSWIIAYLLYIACGRRKAIPVAALALETAVLTAMAAMGRIWPNKTYVGANVLLVIFTILAFGTAAYLFHRMSDDAVRRFTRVCWLVVISGLATDYFATEHIKKAVARPRPLNDANKPWNEQVRTVPDEVLRGRNSFPSGHTAGTFSLVAPLFWYVSSRRLRAALVTWGALQGFARVYTAAHFPLCVTMGGLLGFTTGTMVFFILGPLFGLKRDQAAPQVLECGGRA